MRQPSVFMSYSWDSATHKRWVAAFAARLEQNGVRVWLDQWHVKAGDSLTKFMESKIRSSGHVVVVCTPAYARKSNARQGGVGFEQQIISAHRLANIPRRKILPVLEKAITNLEKAALFLPISAAYTPSMLVPSDYLARALKSSSEPFSTRLQRGRERALHLFSAFRQ